MPLVGLLILGSVCADVGTLSMLHFGAAMKVFLGKRLTSKSKYLLYKFTQVTADVEESSVIIGERSRAAIEALRRAIDESHHRIAILMVLATCQTWEGNYGRSSIIFLPGFNG
ncbi:hypothetical protein KPL71_000718 [Citrus sinensis]|uniref:Uncharacterized protein n=1 Tax=Citrus sinensis TaxID=2711 RepID=A0ACB8NR12_CITSI|nr:hypothetical protein KPL71_000718 [Citrus sinensis]